jgi:hypothetical protein
MDPTLAAILSELFRLAQENDSLKRRIAELEAAAALKTAPAEEGD